MPLSFSFDEKSIEELEDLQKYLEKMQSKVELSGDKAKEELKKDLQEVMFEDMKLRFASSPGVEVGGTVHGGQEWSSLSDMYLKMNPNRLGGQIYIDSGDLMNSLVSMTPDTISEFEESTGGLPTFNFGTRLKYAEKLQELRPIVFLHEELNEKIVDKYQEFIIKKDKK